MKIVCAWCQRVMQAGSDSEVSHGICEECEAKFLEQLEENSS
jgi:hypothetical protein